METHLRGERQGGCGAFLNFLRGMETAYRGQPGRTRHVLPKLP